MNRWLALFCVPAFLLVSALQAFEGKPLGALLYAAIACVWSSTATMAFGTHEVKMSMKNSRRP